MTAFLAALLLAALPAGAQTLTTVNENLATSSNTMLVDTNSNRLDVGTYTYTGSVPGAVLFVGSNVVVGTGTGAASEVVIYATGTVMVKGVQVATGTILAPGISTGAAVNGSMFGDGNGPTPLGVLSSSAVVRESNLGIRIASATLTGTGNGLFDLTLSSGMRFTGTTTGIVWADGSTSTSAAGGAGPAGPAGPAGSPAGTLGYVLDKFLAQANGSQKTFTLTFTPSSNSEHVNLDGHILSGTSDYTLVNNVVTMTTAPATACTVAAPSNCTSLFQVDYATGATGVNAFILNSSQTVSGTNTFTSTFTLLGSTVVANNVIHNSVCVNNFSASTANQLFSVGYATVTITTSGTDPLRVTYSGMLGNTSGGGNQGCASFLVDGKFDSTSGLNAAKAITCSVSGGTGVGGSFSWTTSAQAQGVHNVIFLLADTGGAGSALACASVALNNGVYTPANCQFCVEEVK